MFSRLLGVTFFFILLISMLSLSHLTSPSELILVVLLSFILFICSDSPESGEKSLLTNISLSRISTGEETNKKDPKNKNKMNGERSNDRVYRSILFGNEKRTIGIRKDRSRNRIWMCMQHTCVPYTHPNTLESGESGHINKIKGSRIASKTGSTGSHLYFSLHQPLDSEKDSFEVIRHSNSYVKK